jgi:hypothetical protein
LNYSQQPDLKKLLTEKVEVRALETEKLVDMVTKARMHVPAAE